MNENKITPELIISRSATILDAMKQMDKVDKKLLLVIENEKFIGLVSLGDIQRAIIANKPYTTTVENVIRDNFIVSYENEDINNIRDKMLTYRIEVMPVLTKDNRLKKILFWDDIISEEKHLIKNDLDIPVIIMAGGKGTRLKPITNIIPKALVPIGEKPMIEVIIENFSFYGVTKFFISVNYKAEMIKNYFNNMENHLHKINFVEEKNATGTAGSLSLLKGKINETFFVSNCDILIKQDYRDIYKYHRDNKNELTIVSSLKSYQIPYGIVESGTNGTLLNIEEKPLITYMINTGMYILEPGLLDEIPTNTFFHITELISKMIKQERKIGVFPISEKSLIDIGDWKTYQSTIDALRPRTIND